MQQCGLVKLQDVLCYASSVQFQELNLTLGGNTGKEHTAVCSTLRKTCTQIVHSHKLWGEKCYSG